ncbi:YVTN repeat-like/Quino protein amine dehydrogenase [Laetiporus sulphureus 93-53]|uniref:YVTN repeat-like/Quino protein amine dehydrogenase n=1 Tax=Laetiporus sulphureus 93-53 TaxID=1314785 RepID=A0A165BZ36_9APHY|nr:YVTN repeat-like/Quino protein amine dehydrogenase [Laetiporus sulphureus 93-53]KZT01911.1 YVTN repeat-like/Quino protein amine dehydrogenase [Laetiporus sulphureus 93-53]
MDFTEIYKQSTSLVVFSPGAHFLLTAIQDHLIVRRSDSFQITRSWALEDAPSATMSQLMQSTSSKPPSNKVAASTRNRLAASRGAAESLASSIESSITHAGWSSDSEYIFGACSKRGVVEVFKMRDEDWRARIETGAEGLVKAEWAPDGRTIVCWSEWGLRLTLWSLVTGSATYIQFPAQIERGYAFRSDGHYLVLAERHKSRDTVGIYDAEAAYRLVRHFPIPTSSLSILSLSPTGNYIAVCEGPLEFKVHVLSLAGNLQGTFAPERDPGFGVRATAWHPAGLFLAVLGWDDKMHVLENLTWGPIAVFELQSKVPSGVTIWHEPDKWLEATHGRGFLSYERIQAPHSLTLSPRDRSKPPPELGTAKANPGDYLAWNADGSYLMVRYAGAPNTTWLYKFPGIKSLTSAASREGANLRPTLHTVLVHAAAVGCAQWNPVRKGSLAMCTGGGAVYLWSDEWVSEGRRDGDADGGEAVAECVGVPAERFSTHSIRWAPDGRGLILLDRDTFCCAFEVEDADNQEA